MKDANKVIFINMSKNIPHSCISLQSQNHNYKSPAFCKGNLLFQQPCYIIFFVFFVLHSSIKLSSNVWVNLPGQNLSTAAVNQSHRCTQHVCLYLLRLGFNSAKAAFSLFSSLMCNCLGILRAKPETQSYDTVCPHLLIRSKKIFFEERGLHAIKRARGGESEKETDRSNDIYLLIVCKVKTHSSKCQQVLLN